MATMDVPVGWLTKSTAARTTAPCAGFVQEPQEIVPVPCLTYATLIHFSSPASSSVLRLQPTGTLVSLEDFESPGCHTSGNHRSDQLAMHQPQLCPVAACIPLVLDSSPCAALLSAAFLYLSFGSLHANHRLDLS